MRRLPARTMPIMQAHRYVTYTPPAPLDRFIENFWYWESDAPGHARDTIMASGRMGLLVNLGGNELSWYGGERYAQKAVLRGIALCGTNSRAFAIDAFQAHMMGVQFRAGGAFPFFGPPGRDFQNTHLSLEEIWGGRARSLHAQLVEARTPRAKFAILLIALLEMAPRAFEHHPAVDFALDRFNRAPVSSRVAAAAADAGLSQKKFIRLFTDEVGVTPKLYLRVARFQKLLDRVWDMPSVDWAPLAAAHGYYDQPHLIRDFREFSGFTPCEYLALRGPFPQHVPLPS